jgi:hypothetical protein
MGKTPLRTITHHLAFLFLPAVCAHGPQVCKHILSLSLFVPCVHANNAHDSLTADDCAFGANFTY